MTLLVGWQEGHSACKKTEWWGAGMVICLERGADLHTAQLMPLPLTVSCFSKIEIGLTFLVLAHLGSPGQRAVKRMCVCVCVVVLFWFSCLEQSSIRMIFTSAITDTNICKTAQECTVWLSLLFSIPGPCREWHHALNSCTMN